MDCIQQVFVVDDDEPVRDSIGMLLDAVDIPYKAYADAQSFLSDLQSDERGCLILDIKMPGMSGLELQKKLLQLDIIIPIIFITGLTKTEDEAHGFELGAID
ncbi:MAG: response regulator, partial [Pseudomonadales bacterium]|nr:response regulator [Pseudomonadales bacterium]